LNFNGALLKHLLHFKEPIETPIALAECTRARVERFESAKRRMEETHLDNLRASCPQLPPPPTRRKAGAPQR
jgi:hypothetical protein